MSAYSDNLSPDEREIILITRHDFGDDEASAWVHTTYGNAEDIVRWRRKRKFRDAKALYDWFADDFDGWMMSDIPVEVARAAHDSKATRAETDRLHKTGQDLGLSDQQISQCIRAGYDSDTVTRNAHQPGFHAAADAMAGLIAPPRP